MYVQAIMDSLNKRFHNLLIFNAYKIFSLEVLSKSNTTMLKQWLESLTKKIGLTTIKNDASRAELLEFLETLRHEHVTNH